MPSSQKNPPRLCISPFDYVDPTGHLQSGHLTVEGGRIKSLDTPPGVGDQVLDGTENVFFPGMIQGHVHLCQTLLRGVADDVPLKTWLEEFIWPGEAAHTRESLAASAELGIAELLLGGTTTIVDMGTVRHTEVLFEVAERMGIRYIGGKTLMTDPSMVPPQLLDDSRTALDESAELCRRWHDQASGRLQYAVSPRFRVSCTPETMAQSALLARDLGCFYHTHASETRWENDYIAGQTGRTNIRELAHLGCLDHRTILAHGIWIEEDEWELLKAQGVLVTHCPSANCKLGSGVFPMEQYREQAIPFAIGADGPPCNNNLDALTEARLALNLQNARHGAGWATARDAFRWLTSVPSDHLGLEAGRIAVGARADLFATYADGYHGAPSDWSNPLARLIYAEGSRHIAANIVDGRVLVWDGKLTDLDHREVVARAREERLGLMRRL